jgi:hypothetical protein
MDSPIKLRTVIETRVFLGQKSELSPAVERLDEVLFGVTWALARNPERFPLVLQDPDIRVVKTDRVKEIPALRIFFSSNANEVKLLWLEELGED